MSAPLRAHKATHPRTHRFGYQLGMNGGAVRVPEKALLLTFRLPSTVRLAKDAGMVPDSALPPK